MSIIQSHRDLSKLRLLSSWQMGKLLPPLLCHSFYNHGEVGTTVSTR